MPELQLILTVTAPASRTHPSQGAMQAMRQLLET
jgi:hypothetical protein